MMIDLRLPGLLLNAPSRVVLRSPCDYRGREGPRPTVCKRGM